MWAIRWFLAVVMILVILGFALQNSNESVTVVFLGDWQLTGVQLWMVIYSSFAVGVFFWLIVSIFQVLALKNELRKLRRTNEETRNELDSLRNLPIEDDGTDFDIKEEV